MYINQPSKAACKSYRPLVCISKDSCLFVQTELCCAGVGGEAFAVGQDAGDFAQLLRALLRYLYQARAFLEIVHAQW